MSEYFQTLLSFSFFHKLKPHTMHIHELRTLLNDLEQQGLTEVRCLDDMTGTSLEVYDKDKFWQESYASFKDFYQFMESNRLREVYLIRHAKPAILVGAGQASLS